MTYGYTLSKVPKYFPARFALFSICSQIPAESGVITAARLYAQQSVKVTKISQQITFLEKIRKQKLFPASIQRQKGTNILGNRKQHLTSYDAWRGDHSNLDTNSIKTFCTTSILGARDQDYNPKAKVNSAQLSTLNPHTYKTEVWIENQLIKFTWNYRKGLLKLLIAQKYCDLRVLKHEMFRQKQMVYKNGVNKYTHLINKIVDTACNQQREMSKVMHNNKYLIALHGPKTPKPRNINNIDNNQSKIQIDPKSTKTPGVLNMVENTNNNEAIKLLNKGRNFKMTPQNMKVVKENFEIGVERFICGLKYANPGWTEKESTTNPSTGAPHIPPHKQPKT